ncbi:MAG: hypothetical protein ACAI44_33140 [Candidatus Sericytochromatia bacterium]
MPKFLIRTLFVSALTVTAFSPQTPAAQAGTDSFRIADGQLNGGVEIQFPASEAKMDGIFAIMIPMINGTPFSSDGASVYVSTMRAPTAATLKAGYGQHLNQIQTSSGKIVGDIPYVPTFPKNRVQGLVGKGFRIDRSYGITVGKNLVANFLAQDHEGLTTDPDVVWPVVTNLKGQPVRGMAPIKAMRGIGSMMLTPDERFLVAESQRSTVESTGDFVDVMQSENKYCVLNIWEIASGKLISQIDARQIHPNTAPGQSCGGVDPYYAIVGDELIYSRNQPVTHDEYGDATETEKLEQAWAASPKVNAYNFRTRQLRALGGQGFSSWWGLAYSVFSPDGKWLVASARTGNEEDFGPEFPRLFSLPDMQEHKSLDLRVPVDAVFVKHAWSPDRQHLLFLGISNGAGIPLALHYDLNGNRQISFHQLPFRKDFIPNGNWDAAKGKFVLIGYSSSGPGQKLVWM